MNLVYFFLIFQNNPHEDEFAKLNKENAKGENLIE